MITRLWEELGARSSCTALRDVKSAVNIHGHFLLSIAQRNRSDPSRVGTCVGSTTHAIPEPARKAGPSRVPWSAGTNDSAHETNRLNNPPPQY
jgi:hypothetical protein